MQISAITANDIEEIRELQPEGWPDIISHFNFYIESAFCKPLKFVNQQKIVGIGSSIIYPYSAWLGHIIVHRDFRNQGIGLFITKTLVERLVDGNCNRISLIATDLGKPVYEKLGFVTETNYEFYKKEKHSNTLFHSKHITPASTKHHKEILALDKLVYGEERFALLNPHLAKALICVENDSVRGFYLPTLGEGLIVANDKSAGINLSKLRIQTQNTTVLPQENQDAIIFLKENGWEFIKTASKMCFSEKLVSKPEWLFNRSGGNVG